MRTMKPGEKTFIHYRLFVTGEDKPLSRGGATVCLLRAATGSVWAGVTICSHRQNYCRKIGRAVSEAAARGEPVGKQLLLVKEGDFALEENMSKLQLWVVCVFNEVVLKWDELAPMPSKNSLRDVLKSVRSELAAEQVAGAQELARRFDTWQRIRMGDRQVNLDKVAIRPSGRKKVEA